MRKLNRDLEYLLWFEPHRERWVATPIVRHGPMILDSEYTDAVPLYFVEDRARDQPDPTDPC